jgi:tRNA-2-methylthio-N6-dimethylallyladenosine synthase
MFSYSPRPGTPANELTDSVPLETKKQRLQETIALQSQLTAEQGQSYIGKNVEVLIEGRSPKPGYAFKGRTPHYWSANIEEREGVKPGDTVNVKVEKVSGHSLNGKALTREEARNPFSPGGRRVG